jgi:hypothetical protein
MPSGNCTDVSEEPVSSIVRVMSNLHAQDGPGKGCHPTICVPFFPSVSPTKIYHHKHLHKSMLNVKL